MIEITIEEGASLGITPADDDGKVVVKAIDPGSVAEKSGVKVGDAIVQVGTTSVRSLAKQDVINLVKKESRPLKMVFESGRATSTAISVTSAMPVVTMAPINTAQVALSPGKASAMIGGSYGDRKATRNGMTAWTANAIEISSWELKEPGQCETFCLALRCSKVDMSRSYAYIRSNGSIELNDTNGLKACCTCCWEAQDNIGVYYFDRSPLADTCNIAQFCVCCCIPYSGSPKIEVLDHGYMCCFIKIDPCCKGKEVVLMPFETMPPPCCCSSNRTSGCDNCFGLCGPPQGNPKIFSPFSPQPKDPVAFVAAVQLAMSTAKATNKGAPDVAEMER
jgi:hypothetical protein